MDSARFDGLVRALGQARSRRQTLRGLAGAGAALLLGLPAATTVADCQRQCEEKDNGAQRRCRERCREEKQDQDDGRLGSGAGLRDCSQVPKVPGADLSNCDLPGVNLRGADLRDATLAGANLSSRGDKSADLTGANLQGADLTGANLHRAILGSTGHLFDHGANLSFAILIKARLTFANLAEANLTGANLFGADLLGATLAGAIFCRTTMPDGQERNDNC